MSEQAPDVVPHTDVSAATRPAALLREVRLGLVCYGGVSLAIYMHGVTKELYKLVRLSRPTKAWTCLSPRPMCTDMTR